MNTKQCKLCKFDLELKTENFGQSTYVDRHGNTKTYWCSYCRRCNNLRTKEWHRNNKEQAREKEKKYRENHPQKVKQRKSAYRKRNGDKISEYNKSYRIQHRDVRRQQDKNRRQNDIAFRLRKIISRSVAKAISKGGSITKYLPYSFQELKAHLEKQFEVWMTWQNHGLYNPNTWNDNDPTTWTWHIDHIIPQSKLLYTSMKDDNFTKCWALDNLRPLSAKQNVIDGASRARHQ